MYETFYGLKEKPFSILPDPGFIYWGETHSLAYTMLDYGITNRAGFTVITGEIGSGKTTLIRHLLAQLDEDVTVGLISNVLEDTGDLLHWLLMAFGQPVEEKPHVALFAQLQQFLIDDYAKGHRTVLIIDEAQNLGAKALEELRLLSNINADKDQLLQIVLVGQPQLRDLLQRPELAQLAQRVSSDFHLKPLSLLATHDYIAHRLKIAGREKALFTMAAVNDIYEATQGIPRLINILCDTVLVYGFSIGTEDVSTGVVAKVLRDRSKSGVLQQENPPTLCLKPFQSRRDEASGAALARTAEINKVLLSKILK